MSFDDIPENRNKSYPYPNCENGNVIVQGNQYECDCCSFSSENVEGESNGKTETA